MIDILLATYDGEKYLAEQIDSILAQSNRHWRLLIRDDGSGDNTPSIIRDYAARYSDRIVLIEDDGRRLGACANFQRLLENSIADYVMFCDQDDVWLPDKIKITLERAREIENSCGANTPVLIHTDLRVTDENMNVIARSFWKYQNLNPEKGKTLNRLLVQNVVTGCTVMINRALKEKITLLPQQTIMYDRWIALVAAAFGKIDYVPTATMLYRQHGKNDIGAKEWGLDYMMNMAGSNRHSLKPILQKTQQQAGAFLDTFRDELTETQVRLLDVYSTLGRQSFLVKRLNLIRYGFLKIGLIRNIGLFVSV